MVLNGFIVEIQRMRQCRVEHFLVLYRLFFLTLALLNSHQISIEEMNLGQILMNFPEFTLGEEWEMGICG